MGKINTQVTLVTKENNDCKHCNNCNENELIKVKFLEEITVLHWEEFKFVRFRAGNVYFLPLKIAKIFQQGGYCFFEEKVNVQTMCQNEH